MKANHLAMIGFCGLFLGACDRTDPAGDNNWPLACDYASFEAPADLLTHCAARDKEGEITIRPDLLGAIEPRSALHTIHVDASWLFATDGKTAVTLTYDNGADYFQDGLARAVRGGKIGFINESLEWVIAPAWDFAFPFQDGYALICNGCEAVSDGEHDLIEGGVWGMIDRNGQIAVEPVFRRDALPAPPE